MRIIFTDHAKFKFKILERHGFKITENNIRDIVRRPTITGEGTKGRKILQGQFNDDHVIRVICEIKSDEVRIITFYPARRDRYEN
jgi:uncharacterized DUF497 family protein